MNFQRLDRYKRAAAAASMCYPGGEVWLAELALLSENATFYLTIPGERRPSKVMRASRVGYHSLEELKAEACWLEHLQKTRAVRTAALLPNGQGELLTQVEVEGQSYVCAVFEYLEGVSPKPKEDREAVEDFWQVGRIAASLHKDTMEWRESSRLLRPHWSLEHMVGVRGLFGNWRESVKLSLDERQLLERVCCRIREELGAYGINKDNYGLIHADLRASNLLKKGKMIQVIDFDDCGFGWHLYDGAASISFVEDDPRAGQWIGAWLKGYETVRPLKERDVRMLPAFVMARRIQLLAWVTSHRDSQPVGPIYEGFAGATAELARRYEKGSLLL